ncbi:MAG: thiamine phosphate synthase [Pseudomonadota bacterium]
MADADPARLYLVSPVPQAPDADAGTALAARLEAALATGLVACLRLDLGARADDQAWTRAVNALLPICHAADVPLLATDRPALVAPLGLDGVHLVQSTASIRRLRSTLGADVIIGAWGGAERHRAMTLAEAGADYVSVGPVGPEAEAVYAWWSDMIETPLVAEGGVDPAAAARIGEIVDFATPDPALVWDDPAAALPAFAAALTASAPATDPAPASTAGGEPG